MSQLYSTDRTISSNTATVSGEFTRDANILNTYSMADNGNDGGGGSFGNTVLNGNTIERGTEIELNNVSVYTPQSITLRSRRITEARGTAGALLQLTGSTLLVPAIRATWINSNSEDSAATGYVVFREDSDESGTIALYRGSHLQVGQTGFNSYQSMMGNQGNGRWIVRDSAITSGEAFGTAESYGTTASIMYLGYQSEFNNAILTVGGNYEVQGPFKEFTDTTLRITNNSNQIGGKPYIYAAGKANTYASFSGIPEVVLTVSEPTAPVYCGTKHSNSYLEFAGGIPQSIGGWQFGVGYGSGSAPTLNNGFYFNSPVTSTSTTLDSVGVPSNTTGQFILWNADKEDVVNTTYASGSVPSTSVRWYEWVRGGVNTGGEINFPVGYPDGSSGAIRYHDSGSELGASKAAIRGGTTASLANLATNTATTARTRNAAHRSFPWTTASVQYGQKPVMTQAIGAAETLGTGTVTGANVKEIEDALLGIKSGYAESHTLAYDAALAVTKVNTKTKAAAIGGVTFTNTASLLSLTVDSDLDLTDVHAAITNWVEDSALSGGNFGVTTTASGDVNWTNDAGDTSPPTDEPTLYTTDYSYNTSTQTTAAADTDFSAINFIRFGTNGNTAVANRQRGSVAIWRDSSNYGIYDFVRDGGDTFASNSPQAALTPIHTVGNIGSDATTMRMNVGWNRQCLGFTYTNTQFDYLSSVSMQPTNTSGNVMEVNAMAITTDSEVAQGDFFSGGVRLLDGASIDLSGQELQFDVEGSSSGNNGILTGIRTGTATTNPIAASTVTIGADIDVQLARGSVYFINNDCSAATFPNASGSTGNATIYLGPNGSVPSTLGTNIVVVKGLTITMNQAFPSNGRIDVFDYTGNTLVNTTPIASYTTSASNSIFVNSVTNTGFTSSVTRVRIAFSADGGYIARSGGDFIDVDTTGLTSSVNLNWVANTLYNSAATAPAQNVTLTANYTGRTTISVPHTYSDTSGANGQKWMADQLAGTQIYNTVVARNGVNGGLFITSNTKTQLDPTYWQLTPSVGGVPTGQIPLSNRSGYTGSLQIFVGATNSGSYTANFTAPADTAVDYGAITADAQSIADAATNTVTTETDSLLSDITAEFIAAQD